MLDSIYNMTLKLHLNHVFLYEIAKILPYIHDDITVNT